jgi:hypothetical protein
MILRAENRAGRRRIEDAKTGRGKCKARGGAANPRRNVRDRCVDVNQELPAGGMH